MAIRLIKLLFCLICFTNSLAQGDKKAIGKLKWEGEVTIEKGYAEDVKVIVLRMNSNADTIRTFKLSVKKRFDNRGKCAIEFDNGQLYKVIFLPDTTTHQPAEFVVNTNVPQKRMDDFFQLSFHVGLNISSIALASNKPMKSKKMVTIKFDEKANKYYHLEN